MNQKIIFTTLPNARSDGDQLHASVLVTMKLTASGESTLAAFPDVAGWLTKVRNAVFGFRFSNGTYIEAVPDFSLLDDELFASVFYPGIKVKSFGQEEPDVKRIHSFPVKHIADYLENLFGQYAVDNPDKPLSAFDIAGNAALAPLSSIELNQQVLDQIGKIEIQPMQMRLMNLPGEEIGRTSMVVANSKLLQGRQQLFINNRFVPFSATASPYTDFAQFRDFHKLDRSQLTIDRVNVKLPEFEFHDVLAVLGSYPFMQRKLGLVLDFVFKRDDSIPSKGKIWLDIKNLERGSSSISCLSTAYVLSASGFYADTQPGSMLESGFLRINTPQFVVIQGDVDGAAMKASQLAESKTREVGDFHVERLEMMRYVLAKPDINATFFPKVPVDDSLPHFNSAGIAVARNGMSDFLNTKLKRVTDINTIFSSVSDLFNDSKPLFADDLTQGYRMDIAYSDNPGKWYSLHWRKQQFEYFDKWGNSHPIEGFITDEGFVELAVTGDDDDVFVSETLVRWEGWSLSVDRPGFAINEADDQAGDSKYHRDYINRDKSEELRKYLSNPKGEFRIGVQTSIVPGTLPRLRFGREYDLRVRSVDLAGNSIPQDENVKMKPDAVVRSVRYMRQEALLCPFMFSGTVFRKGESMEHLVIRSNYDVTADDFEKSTGGKPYSVRYFLPPQGSQMMAEMHGMFDKFIGKTAAEAKVAYDMITSLEGKYPSDANGGTKVYEPGELDVIYLPDPMAAGVAVFLCPDHGQTHSQQFEPRMMSYFYDDDLPQDAFNKPIPDEWYKARHVRLRIEEGKEIDAKWDKKERQLTVFLPKSCRMMLKFSSFWRGEDLKQVSALWDWVSRKKPANIKDIEKLALTGRHSMLSPAREIELVHAVKQPLEIPVIEALVPVRKFAETDVSINIRFKVHGKSTGEVTVRAMWNDPYDDGVSAKPGDKAGHSLITGLTINYNDDVITKGNVNISASKESPVRVGVNSARKFIVKGEYSLSKSIFKPQINKYFELISLILEKPLVQNFEDTKHRWVDYFIDAFSRYKSYFDDSGKQENGESVFSRSSLPFERVNILSSSRPAPPEIDYIMPTFEWRKTQHGSSFRHRRMGGGLRVYLKRPWFSSGEGEKLAVVLPYQDEVPKISMLVAKIGYTDFYTHWGSDPIHVSSQAPETYPLIKNFK
jgi:hypothetical protein